ncbi:MATE family efflux transporter [Halonatronum saccharophilum]|uniref:MATE family efflux transporter n=1 Tax=Halonatronum saccharophilum TaxID=150060 RepID=UPI0004B02F74|nr:MATE family efflux transporter [Halonatronum saccharophilum]
MKREINLSEKSITKSLFILAGPMILSNLMNTLYNIVDTIWVGRLGASAVAAISLAFPIIFLLISIGMGFTIAGTSLVAQAKGAKDQKRVNRLTGQILILVTLVSIMFSFIGFFFNESILMIMGAKGETLRLATDFLNIIFIGLTPMFIYFVFTSVLRGLGDSLTPMKLMALSTVINIILDPLLIFGVGPFPRLEVAGAALATTLARTIVAIMGVKILLSGDYGVELGLEDFKPNLSDLKRIIKIGIPASLEQSTKAIGMALMTSLTAYFGTRAVAAFGIGNRILSVVYMLSLGFGGATTVLVGQNLGANKSKKAEDVVISAVLINFILLMVFSLTTFIFSESIVKVFNNDPEVLRMGSDYLKIIAFSFGFIGTLRIVNGAFKGAADTMPAMFFSLLTLCILQVPIAGLLAHNFELGVSGIWWGVAIANTLGAISSFLWFKRGYWKQKVVLAKVKKEDIKGGA